MKCERWIKHFLYHSRALERCKHKVWTIAFRVCAPLLVLGGVMITGSASLLYYMLLTTTESDQDETSSRLLQSPKLYTWFYLRPHETVYTSRPLGAPVYSASLSTRCSSTQCSGTPRRLSMLYRCRYNRPQYCSGPMTSSEYRPTMWDNQGILKV